MSVIPPQVHVNWTKDLKNYVRPCSTIQQLYYLEQASTCLSPPFVYIIKLLCLFSPGGGAREHKHTYVVMCVYTCYVVYVEVLSLSHVS